MPSEDSFKIHFEILLNQDIPMNDIDVTDCPYIPILDDPISVAETKESVAETKESVAETKESVAETKESVAQLNPHKAAGLNGVPPGLCKLLPATWITFISTLLCIIFTKSLFPVEWTLSRLITLKAKNFAAKVFTAEKFHGFRGCSERKILISQDVIFAVGKILKNSRDVIFAGLKNFRETFRGFSKKTRKPRKPRNFMPRNFSPLMYAI